MSPKDKANTAGPPDCPREYHDDYIGRSPPKRRGAVLLAAAAILLGVCGVIYALSQAGIG